MSALIKKIISFLPQKKYLWSFFGSFLICLMILFPYNDVIQQGFYKVSQNRWPLKISYNSHDIGFFPLQLSFQNVTLFFPKFSKSINIEKLVVKPYYWSFLLFKPGVKLQIHSKKSSSIQILLSKDSAKNPQSQPVRMSLKSHNLALQNLSTFFPLLNQSQGMVELFADLKLDLNFIEGPEGSIQFKAQDVLLQPYSYMVIETPSLQWKKVDGNFSFEKGDLFLKTFGTKPFTTPLALQAEGVIRMNWKSPLKRIRSYDTKLKMVMSKKMRKDFPLLVTLLSDSEKELSDNRYQYNARISGKYPEFLPDIQKLEEDLSN